jgi:hypothetical protein
MKSIAIQSVFDWFLVPLTVLSWSHIVDIDSALVYFRDFHVSIAVNPLGISPRVIIGWRIGRQQVDGILHRHPTANFALALFDIFVSSADHILQTYELLRWNYEYHRSVDCVTPARFQQSRSSGKISGDLRFCLRSDNSGASHCCAGGSSGRWSLWWFD